VTLLAVAAERRAEYRRIQPIRLGWATPPILRIWVSGKAQRAESGIEVLRERAAMRAPASPPQAGGSERHELPQVGPGPVAKRFSCIL